MVRRWCDVVRAGLVVGVVAASAGQGWAVDLSKDFIGQPVLKRVKEEGPKRRLVGLELEGRRIAREGAEIHADGQVVGAVTSGTRSPTLERPIAMGYLDSPLSEPGSTVEIDIRGGRGDATVVKLPFYKRVGK